MVQLLILGYCIVLVFSYPLQIFPCNQILESWFVDPFIANKSESAQYWIKNVPRVFVCSFAAYLGINYLKVLDKIIALIGAICCAPLAMIIPTLCHLLMMAKTPREKLEDALIISVSVVVLSFCIMQTLMSF